AGGQLGTDARQVIAHTRRVEDVDQTAPPGEVAGEVEGRGCRDAEAGPPVRAASVVAAVQAEAVPHDRDEAVLDEHRGPGLRPSLLNVVDDRCPGRVEIEIGWA